MDLFPTEINVHYFWNLTRIFYLKQIIMHFYKISPNELIVSHVYNKTSNFPSNCTLFTTALHTDVRSVTVIEWERGKVSTGDLG